MTAAEESKPEFWIVRSRILGTSLLVFGLASLAGLILKEPLAEYSALTVVSRVSFCLMLVAGGLAFFQSPGTQARRRFSRAAGAGAILCFSGSFLQSVWANAEHYNETEKRIDSMMPADRGLAPTPTFPEDRRLVQIHLTLLHPTDPDKRQTTIRLGDDGDVLSLPVAWRGRSEESDERVLAYDTVIAALRKQLHQVIVEGTEVGLTVSGEITLSEDTPAALVPQGEIVQCLNLLLEEGLSDVSYQGPVRDPGGIQPAPR